MVPSSSGTVKNNNELHKEVLGGIVTANGFFTGAVFLSVTGTVTPLPGIPTKCVAGDDITLKLFLFQLWSLGFYFLSSLIATATKLIVVYFHTDESRPVFQTPAPLISSSSSMPPEYHQPSSWAEQFLSRTTWLEYQQQTLQLQEREYRRSSNSSSRIPAMVLAPYVRRFMLSSVALSAVASFFLLLSVVNLVQIKLGLLSCGHALVVVSVGGIALLILLGLAVYIFISWYLFTNVK